MTVLTTCGGGGGGGEGLKETMKSGGLLAVDYWRWIISF